MNSKKVVDFLVKFKWSMSDNCLLLSSIKKVYVI